MAKRKDILNAALKALLASAETVPLLKVIATFISELASLPENQRKTLDPTLPDDQFKQLLIQAELSTTNAALAAAGTEQIKKMVLNSFKLTKNQLGSVQKKLVVFLPGKACLTFKAK
ncbi:MAG: hypothetical protein JXD22_14885 [Sedimentisphaerales bacterium]|nr:hypothetical protein [Sedimentisphaerales bacterium]